MSNIQYHMFLHYVPQTVHALMGKWSVAHFPALVSALTRATGIKFFLLIFPINFLAVLSLSCVCLCVSQWTVAGAAGHSGVHAVERVMLVLDGGIVQGPILLLHSVVDPAKEKELGLIPAVLNPALVRVSLFIISVYSTSVLICETEPNKSSCDVYEGVKEPWSAWSKCSVTCGGGYRTRTRGPIRIHGTAQQFSACNLQPCGTTPHTPTYIKNFSMYLTVSDIFIMLNLN